MGFLLVAARAFVAISFPPAGEAAGRPVIAVD
jgi:hypothetical protein